MSRLSSRVSFFNRCLVSLTSIKMLKSGATFKTGGRKLKKPIRCKPKTKPQRFSLTVVENPKIEVLENPIQSESDKKKYKVIQLENGLRALLISDVSPEKPASGVEEAITSSEDDDSLESCTSDDGEDSSTEEEDTHDGDTSEEMGSPRKAVDTGESQKAACALCVNVGSLSDPLHIQGMAHFVEHMLFMGSKKYPKENDFDSFIKKKGGSDNASTDCEVTTFYFDIEETVLDEAMDKFAQFFVSPLMKQEAMQRERESIESEFNMALPVDDNRKDQLLCMLLPEGHPGRSFMWGDSRSLSAPKGPSDPDLYQAAHDFKDRHYSAHRMTVAVQARLPLETLEKYVVSTFGLIASNNLDGDDFSQYAFKPETITPDFHSIYYIKPVRQVTEVVLNWGMKSFQKHYLDAPQQYVSWIIGHEGTGSLSSYLRRNVWALDVTAGNSESNIYHTSLMYYFSINMRLTQDGLENIDKVIDAVFGYIKMIKEKLPIDGERIFKEIQTIEDINFKFEDESEPSDNVESLAEAMHYYPPKHYLTGLSLSYNYNPELINYVLNAMTPETVNIMISSQSHKVPIQYDQTEEWFGTEYKKTAIPTESITRWKEIQSLPEFHLPEPNIYITDNFDLIPMPEKSEITAKPTSDASAGNQNAVEVQPPEDAPTLLRNDELVELWFKPDYKFRRQTTIILILLETPLVKESVQWVCLLDMWIAVLRLVLNEKLYAAVMAGLSDNISRGDKGVKLKIMGYNQKLPILVDVITKTMKEYKSFISPVMFSAIKDVQMKQYHNSVIKINSLVRDVRYALTVENHYMGHHKLHALKDIKYEDLEAFGDNFLQRLRAQILIQGNLLKDDAIAISNTVVNNLKWKPMTEAERPKMRIYRLSPGEKYCRVNSFNTHDSNSIVTNYYQSGLLTIKESSILSIVMLLMEEPLFDQLRTKEQLGYSVTCNAVSTFGLSGFLISVNTQADKYSTDHVDSRIEKFLNGFRKEIRELTPKAFVQTKNAVIKSKRTVDTDLGDMVGRNWTEISQHEYTFDRIAQEIKMIEELTLEDVNTWLDEHTQVVGNKARKLSVQIMGKKKDAQSIANLHTDKKIKVDQTAEVLPPVTDYTLTFVARKGDAPDDVSKSKAFFESVEVFQADLQLMPERRNVTPQMTEST